MHGGSTAGPAGAREADRDIPSKRTTATTNDHHHKRTSRMADQCWLLVEGNSNSRSLLVRQCASAPAILPGGWVTFTLISPREMTQGIKGRRPSPLDASSSASGDGKLRHWDITTSEATHDGTPAKQPPKGPSFPQGGKGQPTTPRTHQANSSRSQAFRAPRFTNHN